MLLTRIQKEIRGKIGHFIWEQKTSPVQLHYSPLTLQAKIVHRRWSNEKLRLFFCPQSGPTAESKSNKKQEQLRDKKELEKWYKFEWNQQ
ncbi:hypothetical protein E2320_013369 [Naja naja]|nr:hypothetical protein E2320_013369 [Naja naja]